MTMPKEKKKRKPTKKSGIDPHSDKALYHMTEEEEKEREEFIKEMRR